MEVIRQVDVIPAQPGFNLVTAFFEDGEIGAIHQTAIIAWRIVTWIPEEANEKSRSDHTPIVVNREAVDSELQAIETPDGRFTVSDDGRIFDNSTDLLNYWRKERA